MSRHSAVHTPSGGNRYDKVLEMQKQVHTFPAFPTTYPTSALLGCVSVIDCLSHEDYIANDPDGEENGSAYVFICTKPRALSMPMRISGQHKIWPLPSDMAVAAKAALRPVGATWCAVPQQQSSTASSSSGLSASAAEFKPPPGLSAAAAPFEPIKGWTGPASRPSFDLHRSNAGSVTHATRSNHN